MNAKRTVLLGLAAAVAAAPAALHAQELFFVTGLSRPAAATLQPVDAAPWELAIGRPIVPGRLTVASGMQLMLYEPTGAALVILGPAELEANRDVMQEEISLQLVSGKLVLASDRPAGTGWPLLVRTVLTEQRPLAVEFLAAPGQTFVVREPDRVAVGYLGDPASEGLLVGVGPSSLTLTAGQLLIVDAGGVSQVAALNGWLAEQGLDRAWGRDLGVRSAQVARHDVESHLFRTIISWDRRAEAAYVVPLIRPAPPGFEIRQTLQAVTTVARPVGRGGAVQTEPFAGANEMPVISPAAASLQNLREVGQGVTALELNRNASTLLSTTGSQGLGFRGLRLLAIPGTQGGIPTVGPPGLGGRN